MAPPPPRVSEHEVRITGLDPRHDGVRIAQLSDIHVGNMTPASHVRAAIKVANDAQPDLIVSGINLGLNTRLYFSDEAEANKKDAVLNIIEWEARRATLVAQRDDKGGQVVYRFDIHLQGDAETVFFDV